MIAGISTVNHMTKGALPGPCYYAGRLNRFEGLAASPLANPCSQPHVPCPVCGVLHGNHTGASVPCYKRWLWQAISQPGPQLTALEFLTQLAAQPLWLVCYCLHTKDPAVVFAEANQRCHCQVIARAVRWASQGGRP